jgi:hypothetical protein
LEAGAVLPELGEQCQRQTVAVELGIEHVDLGDRHADLSIDAGWDGGAIIAADRRRASLRTSQ